MSEPPKRTPLLTWHGFVRGALSALGTLLFPLGRFCYCGVRRLRTEERMQQGCTFVLPGIEGRSFLNIGIAAGACGFQTRSVPKGFGEAAELHECPYHMRMALRFNFGGHFGCTNRLFVAEEIAPILRDGEPDTTSS